MQVLIAVNYQGLDGQIRLENWPESSRRLIAETAIVEDDEIPRQRYTDEQHETANNNDQDGLLR